MIIDILNSETDMAGRNIRRAIDSLLEQNTEKAFPLFDGNEVTFHTTPGRIINADKSAVNPEAELIIVVSRHSSVNPVPVLTVHPAGNFGIAQLGGNDNELGQTAPAWMKAVLQNHQKFVPDGYRVSYEITHHGPTDFPAPFFFVEVGSTEKEWSDEAAISAAAKSVLYAKPPADAIPLIGFGGTHYAVRQTAIGLDTKGAFGHIMHTRDVGAAGADTIRQMMEKSGHPLRAHVDHKALSKQEITHITGLLKGLGILEITEGDLLKMNHLSNEAWEKYSELAEQTENGLKIYPHGNISDDDPAVITLPEDFFTAAFGKDDAPLFAYLDKAGNVLHTTGANGKLMPIFLTGRENRTNVSGDLIALSIQQITRTQDSSVDGNTITITRRQFDARLARTLGVPSGPLFGRLAAGEPVTLSDGKQITPEMVTKVIHTSIKIPGLEENS
ncbi:MAG: D-aminoacyl-tRNA deacylase [Methanocorpusculum sp.]|nr:D-aminoacyl-tRNA deacylase [Methanocorpusculum sp.]